MSLRLLEPQEIAARRRPLAILFLFGWELAWALVVSAPAHAWARRVWGAHPDGDAPLWAPGGADLLAFVGAGDAAESTVLRVSFLLLFVGVILSQVPLGVMLASLAAGRGVEGRAPSLGDARRASASTFLPLLSALTLVTLLELVLLGIGGALAATAGGGSVNEIAQATRAILAFAPFALLALGVGVLGDVVRAAIVRDAASNAPSPTAWGSVGRGLRAVWAIGLRGALGACGEWALRAAVALALLGVGALSSDAFGGRGGMALALLFAIHQTIVLARTALRASWLARAVKLVARASLATAPEAEASQPRLTDL